MLISKKIREKLKSRFSSLSAPIYQEKKTNDVPQTLLDYKTRHELSNTIMSGTPSIKLGEKENYKMPSPYNFSSDSNNITAGKTGHLDLSCLNQASPGESMNDKPFYISAFNIQQHPYPYIRYLMYKFQQNSDNNEEVIFPYFRVTQNHEDPVEMAKDKLNDILKGWNSDIYYRGYIETHMGVYLFFENKFTQDFLFNQKRNDAWWWCLVDEIINMKSLLNFPISDTASNIFLQHPRLGIMFDDNNTRLEVPTVAFHGGYYKTISFISVFSNNRHIFVIA